MEGTHVHILKFFVILIGFSTAAKYDGYQVFKTDALSEETVDHLRQVMLSNSHYDFWSGPFVGRSAKIMTSPEHRESLLETIEALGIGYEIVVEDVAQTIRDTFPRREARDIDAAADAGLDFDTYHTHAEINAYLEDLAKKHYDVKVVNIGQSYEGRDMNVLVVGDAEDKTRPTVYIDGGIHAREWIAPAVVTYLIHQLTQDQSANAYRNRFNFHILPVVNPDGYEFTFEHEDNRLWRKTRSIHPNIFGCKGVDPNRNFDYKFASSGVSFEPCSESFPGPFAFSEVETSNVRDYAESLDPKPMLSSLFHSAAELVLWPYGYGFDRKVENWQEQERLAKIAVEALNQVHQQEFVDLHSALLYPAGGDANDWFSSPERLGVRFSNTWELREAADGSVFLLPPEEIRPSGEEVWAAYKAQLDEIWKLHLEEK